MGWTDLPPQSCGQQQQVRCAVTLQGPLEILCLVAAPTQFLGQQTVGLQTRLRFLNNGIAVLDRIRQVVRARKDVIGVPRHPSRLQTFPEDRSTLKTEDVLMLLSDHSPPFLELAEVFQAQQRL